MESMLSIVTDNVNNIELTGFHVQDKEFSATAGKDSNTI